MTGPHRLSDYIGCVTLLLVCVIWIVCWLTSTP